MEGGVSVLPEQDVFIEKLHHLYFNKLTIYAVSVLRDATRAQDVVQDTFHEAVIHIDKLLAHENPGGWLMQTLKNKIKESERSRRRYISRFLSLDSDIATELIAEVEQPVDGAPQVLLKVEKTLTKEEQHLLRRLIFENASHLEVSQELGITVWASQKRLERVRQKQRRVFPSR